MKIINGVIVGIQRKHRARARTVMVKLNAAEMAMQVLNLFAHSVERSLLASIGQVNSVIHEEPTADSDCFFYHTYSYTHLTVVITHHLSSIWPS